MPRKELDCSQRLCRITHRKQRRIALGAVELTSFINEHRVPNRFIAARIDADISCVGDKENAFRVIPIGQLENIFSIDFLLPRRCVVDN